VTLVIVRHGRTAANASGLLLGRADPELDETGHEQARSVGRALALEDERPDVVVCSPLRRAHQTALTIAEACGAGDVVVDERWIELDYGEYDGRPMGDVPAEVWARWRSDADFCPPGGESLRALRARVDAACEAWWAERNGRTVVVTHVSPIKAALGWVLGVGEQVNWRTHVTPASITRIGDGPASPVLRSFNEVAHLG
jgi:broad specificity phosphatase PhoE